MYTPESVIVLDPYNEKKLLQGLLRVHIRWYYPDDGWWGCSKNGETIF